MTIRPFRVAIDGRATSGWQRNGEPGAPVVVLVHGLHGHSNQWLDLTQFLPASWTLIAFDLRGHGASAHRGPYDLQAYVTDVLAVAAARGLEDMHLVGTSFGGSIASAAAARCPQRVHSVTAIGSARVTGGGKDTEAVIAAVHKYGVERFFRFTTARFTLPPGTPHKLIDETAVASADGRDIATVSAVFRGAWGTDIGPLAARVCCPCLVVNGELDATCPPSAGADLARALRVVPQIVAGAGHLAIRERPEEIAHMLTLHVRQTEDAR